MTSNVNCPVGFAPDLGARLREIGWKNVELLDEVDSTNSYALARPRPWSLVAAHAQVAGRGRLTRSWQVPAGKSVSMSAVLPLPAQHELWGWVPLFIGLAAHRAVMRLAPEVGASIKWPNDLIVTMRGDGACPARTDDEEAGNGNDTGAALGRKLAGTLCQVAPVPGEEGVVIAGIGLNVSQTREELPIAAATSLAVEGASVTRDEALMELARQVYQVGLTWRDSAEAHALQDEVRERCSTIGSSITIHLPDGNSQATRAVGIDEDGRLITKVHAGGPKVAYAVGDINHVRRSAQ